MINLGGGLYGFWRVATSDGGRVSSWPLIMAVLVATVPTTVIHELGHMVAGWMVGLKTLHMNFGVGPVVLKKEIGGVLLTIRRLPISGYVIPASIKDTSRLKRAFFVAGGPGANLLSAAALIRLDDIRLLEFFSRPSFGAIFAIANLLQAVMALTPMSSRRSTSAATGSDGWQLQRLLRGKPAHYETDELERLSLRKSGLKELRRIAEGSRQRALLTVILVGASLLAGTIWMTSFTALPPAQLAATLAVEFAVFGGWAKFITRRSWTAFNTSSDRIKCNPHEQQNLVYRHAFQAVLSSWAVGELPKETESEACKLHGKQEFLQRLDSLPVSSQGSKFLNLVYFDELVQAKRHADAKRIIGTALHWEGVPAPVHWHFESLHLATSFSSSPDAETFARCQQALQGIEDDGLYIKRLHAYIWVLASLDDRESLQKAEEWCRTAHAKYPYDPATFLRMGIVLLKQKRVGESRPWLRAARESLTDSNMIIEAEAWLAVAAAYDRQADTVALLRRSLQQDLPLSLRQILDSELSQLSAVEHAESAAP